MNFINDLFSGLNNLQKILILVIVGVVIFAVSAGVSYSLFSTSQTIKLGEEKGYDQIPTASSVVEEDPSIPRTEECPLDGSMHTEKAKNAWELRRPLAVMIENHVEARPQSGLTSANVVYEAIAEGGITRFMGVFLCNLSDTQVGPVRSARTYFLDWLGEYDALYAHVGGANSPGPADALGQIIKYGVKDLNQFSIGFPTFWRDYQRLGRPVATEHTMYSTTQKLWDIGAKRGWSATDSAGLKWDAKFVPWKFKDDQGGSTVNKITVSFWEGKGDYQVEWSYDASCNCYKRKNGGQDNFDLNNKKPVAVKNVIVQFAKESRANDGYEGNVHLLYGTTGKGKVLVFQDGKVIEGEWVKQNRSARTKFIDKQGKEIEFNRGMIWIQTVPEGADVNY